MITGQCAYCGAQARTTDHLIKSNQARRRPRAMAMRQDPCYKVPACWDCNVAIGTRYRVPESHAHLIPDLEAITGNVYATFSGNAADLREVVR